MAKPGHKQGPVSECPACLKWTSAEKEGLAVRIMSLSDEQIIDLFQKTGLAYWHQKGKTKKYSRKDMLRYIVTPLRWGLAHETGVLAEDKQEMDLDILITEANSKKNLLSLIRGFEKENGTA